MEWINEETLFTVAALTIYLMGSLIVMLLFSSVMKISIPVVGLFSYPITKLSKGKLSFQIGALPTGFSYQIKGLGSDDADPPYTQDNLRSRKPWTRLFFLLSGSLAQLLLLIIGLLLMHNLNEGSVAGIFDSLGNIYQIHFGDMSAETAVSHWQNLTSQGSFLPIFCITGILYLGGSNIPSPNSVSGSAIRSAFDLNKDAKPSAGLIIWNALGFLISLFLLYLLFSSMIMLYGLEHVFFVSLNFYVAGMIFSGILYLGLKALGFTRKPTA